MNDKTIIGIDPGTNILGYGIIKIVDKQITIADQGIIKMASNKEAFEKLQIIYDRLVLLIEKYRPQELAIEAPFYGKNVQSMLKLGRAQGVAIAAGLSRGLTICEYAPRKIKMAITGNGNASKEQVSEMIKRLVDTPFTAESFDATDGLAAAICHHFQFKPEQTERYSGWKDFIAKNNRKFIK